MFRYSRICRCLLSDPWYVHLSFCRVTGTGVKLESQPGNLSAASIDLSKATKLKKVTFRSGGSFPVPVTTALRTITSEHKDFQEISIHFYFDYIAFSTRSTIGTEQIGCRRWMDLDHLLLRRYESHGVRVSVKYYSIKGEEACGFIGGVLPETMKRAGIALDFADRDR